jgi:phosphohistidine phosphatase
MKYLYLLRHGKSSWEDAGLPDHDRPLAPRGRHAAKLVAEHLRRELTPIDLVLCSSARRTCQTLEGIARAIGDDVPVQVERELYSAHGDDLLGRLRRVPTATQSVMVVGHNPAIQELTLGLAQGGEELSRVKRKFPTGALATLTFERDWHQLQPQDAELVAFVTPRDLG